MAEPAGRRILVVDDDLPSLDILCALLDDEGCTVLVATRGDAALRAAGRSRPDLILLDVHLGGMDGIETCRRLKEAAATAAIPVVLFSAAMDAATRTAGIGAGAVACLVKRPPWRDVVVRVLEHAPPAGQARRDQGLH